MGYTMTEARWKVLSSRVLGGEPWVNFDVKLFYIIPKNASGLSLTMIMLMTLGIIHELIGD